MQALVIYESMYGNTHLIADAIAAGLIAHGVDASAISVHDATTERVANADLIVVGGPTHAHGLSRDATRDSAIADASKPSSDLHLDPDAEGDGLREWFDALPASAGHAMAAAFDTRVEIPPVISGRASRGIGKRLRQLGFNQVVQPESFFVDKHSVLKPEQESRAYEWGRALTGHAFWSAATAPSPVTGSA